jgi:hypothetical protein
MSVLTGQINKKLVDYMNSPKLDIPARTLKNTTVLGGGSLSGVAYVHQFTENGNTVKEYDKTNIPVVDGVVFSVELDSVLKARLIDPTTNTYQLLFSTNANSEGHVKKVPFFREDLSLRKEEDGFLSGNKSSFKMVPKASELKDEFIRSYNEMLQGDIISLLKMGAITILSFIVLISWICYGILRLGVLNWFLEILRSPSRDSDRRGVDLVKIISFGIFTMDSRPSGLKIGIVNVAIFCMIYLLLGVS